MEIFIWGALWGMAGVVVAWWICDLASFLLFADTGHKPGRKYFTQWSAHAWLAVLICLVAFLSR